MVPPPARSRARYSRLHLGHPGIYLEDQLTTSSRKFEFVFKMFAEDYASLPANGMQAIPDQLDSNRVSRACRWAKK